jgi:hypothetical protein
VAVAIVTPNRVRSFMTKPAFVGDCRLETAICELSV